MKFQSSLRNSRPRVKAASPSRFSLAACQLQRSRACKRMTSFSANASTLRNAATLHHSAGPDVACAGGHDRAHDDEAYASPHRRRRLQRLQHHAGDHSGWRPGQQNTGCARRHVKAGQPMLEVSSPDYSQMLDAYLKAADFTRSPDKTTPVRRTCISTKPSPSAIFSRRNRTKTRLRPI